MKKQTDDHIKKLKKSLKIEFCIDSHRSFFDKFYFYPSPEWSSLRMSGEALCGYF